MIVGLIYAAWSRAVRPTDPLPVDEWASKHVPLIDSATGSPFFTIEQTPWLRDPMRAVADNDNKEIIIIAPVGSGKTTVMEGCIPWSVSEDPGATLVATQSDDKAHYWAKTRLFRSMENCEPIKQLYPKGPKGRHNVTKDGIIFPHMPLSIGGSGMGNLQSSSIRWAWGDEPWIWEIGRMDELRGRNHDRWNARVVFLSQAGVTEDTPWSQEMGNPDLDAAWKMTDMSELRWRCPSCEKYHVWKWEDFRYDEGLDDDSGERNWQEVYDSVKMICPSCGEEFFDLPETRRKLADSSEYFATNDKAVKGRRGFTYTAMVVPWIKWGNLAVQWVKANMAKKKGNLGPLRQFMQKRLAKPWKDELGFEDIEISGSGYVKGEYTEGQLIDNEKARFMAVDVQSSGGRHFWASIRAFRIDGTSRLLWEDKIQTWEMLEDLQEQYKIRPKLVFIDGQHEPEEVKQWCAKNGWNILHGSGTESFPHRVKKGKKTKTIYKPFSPRKAYRVRGELILYWHWGNTPVKDVLATLMAGQGVEWEVPDDVSESYKRQMNSEKKKDVYKDKSKKEIVRKWVKTKQDNHLWDCECMIIAAAMMTGILDSYINNDEDEDEDLK